MSKQKKKHLPQDVQDVQDAQIEQTWHNLLAQPHVQAGLERLAQEVHRQIEAGEVEDGGFAIEDETEEGVQASEEEDKVPLVTEICSMDDIFPGFLQWYKERQAREQAVQVHPLEQGLFEAWKQAIARGEREHE